MRLGTRSKDQTFLNSMNVIQYTPYIQNNMVLFLIEKLICSESMLNVNATIMTITHTTPLSSTASPVGKLNSPSFKSDLEFQSPPH